MSSELVQGKPTKSGKPTYLYYDNQGEVVSLLQDTAEKKGFKPVLNSESIQSESTIDSEEAHTNREEKKIIFFKGPEQLFREAIASSKNFEIYFGDKKIFDSNITNKNQIKFENAGFHIFGKIYTYNGICLKNK